MPRATQEATRQELPEGAALQPLRCIGASLLAGLAIAAVAFLLALWSLGPEIAALVSASNVGHLPLLLLWLVAGAGLGAVQFAFSLGLSAAAERPEVSPQGRMNS